MKILGDKPLIQYSIDFALNNFSKDAIWVNSDDQEIIEFSKEKGIKTLERPDCLATDFASTADVLKFQVNYLKEQNIACDAIILLQPTNPFREENLLKDAIKKFESPVINGDGSYSRDFTYIDNVIQMNVLAITSQNKEAINQVYNTAVGDRTTLVELLNYLKEYLAEYDPKIADIEIKHGPNRVGDIPHSLASIEKAREKLEYKPSHNIKEGLKEAVKWYYKKLK